MKVHATENAISLNIAKSEIGNEVVDSINARDLHIQLWVWKVFANWIKDRIEKYKFAEWEDFAKIGKPQQNNKIDYILTLDTAKEIAMVENNEAGRKIRKYLIEVEKRYRNLHINTQKMSHLYNVINQENLTVNTLIREQNQFIKQQSEFLKQQIEAMKILQMNNEKDKIWIQTHTQKQVLNFEYTCSIGTLAKKLWIWRNALFELLRKHKFLNKDNIPRKNFLWSYFNVRRVETKNGIFNQTVCLPKWSTHIKKLFLEWNLS